MTHGHELQGGNVGGRGGQDGVEWGEWDNCNSIINKYIKKNSTEKFFLKIKIKIKKLKKEFVIKQVNIYKHKHFDRGYPLWRKSKSKEWKRTYLSLLYYLNFYYKITFKK